MAAPQRGSRRRWIVYCVMVACAVFLIIGLLHSIIASDPSAVDRDAAVRSFKKYHELEKTTTSHTYTRRLLRQVDAFLTAHGAPTSSAVDITQFVFVSCNRHDQDQDYWRLMANVAQCEAASWAQRSQSSHCFALYAGVSAGPEEGQGLSVAQGACGAVLPAASHESSTTEPDAAFSRPVDALVWLGDAIYADKREGGSPSLPVRSHADNPLSTVERFWITQRRSPSYTEYRHSCIRRKPGQAGQGPIPQPVDRPQGIAPSKSWVKEDFKLAASAPDVFAVYGTWDDHDMGENDGGADYPYRNTTQRFLLNFIGAEAEDPRWHREGVYNFQTIPFREEIITDVDARTEEEVTLVQEAYVALQSVYENALCVVLLDSRSFRDPPNATEAGDVLGATQWDWLEAILKHRVSDRDRAPHEKRHCVMTLIGTGIQVILDEKPGENWGAFPRSRDKLFALCRQHGVERVALLSGDIHMGEIALDSTEHAVRHVLGFPIVEITSSGLTHSAGDFKGLASLFPTLFPTPRRVGIYMEKNFASVRLLFDTVRVKQYVRPLLAQERTTHAIAAPVVELQHALEAALNVSFTSYAITRFGQPAVRLNLPLEALTTRRGPQYAQAGMRVVSPRSTGYLAAWSTPVEHVVLKPRTTRPAYGTTQITTSALGTVAVPHYPNASPQPFITWLVRTAQHVVFTNYTISQTLVALIKRVLFLSTVLTLIFLWYVYRLSQRRRKRQRQGFSRVSQSGGCGGGNLAGATLLGTGPGPGILKRRSEPCAASTEHESGLGASGHGHAHSTSLVASGSAEMSPQSLPSCSSFSQAPGGATSVSMGTTAGVIYDLLLGETKKKTK